VIEKRKVGNYSEAILKMFDNTKYKNSICGSATCDSFPVNIIQKFYSVD
jgi:hypothetical protein